MEGDINKIIEESTNELVMFVRLLVDECLIQYSGVTSSKIDIDGRNKIILQVIEILEKKFLAPNDTTWELNKKRMTTVIILSLLFKSV